MTVDRLDYSHHIERLLDVCRNLSANLELEPLLQSIIEAASELTHSESSSILVYDKEAHSLRFVAAPWYLMESLKAISVPVERSVAGWVFTHGQPMVLNDANRDERIFRVVDRELSSSTTSLLAVPMVFRGKTIGLLESVNKANNSDYTEEDVIILETLASQAAIAFENRRLLEESQRSYEKLIELDRMKSDFISIASHELRTPLGLILGHATVLQDGVSPEQRQELDVIVRNASRLKEIVEQFSNIDKLTQGLSTPRKEETSILPLVKRVVDSFQDMATEKKIILSLDGDQTDVKIEVDGEKISMALRNLLMNALIFTNEGGQVRVRVEEIPGYLKVSIMDSGIGIPATEQQKIFQRFYQVEKHLRRRHGGMGLGLAITKDLIEMHGGKIWVESTEGQGSRFYFILPRNAAQVSAAQKVFLT